MSAAQGLMPVISMPSVSMNQGPLLASAEQGTREMDVIVNVSMKVMPVQNLRDSDLSICFILLILFTESLGVTLTHGR
jgi:hypothetical protein